MRTIAIINQKGGVGKSTTTNALWAGLSSMGYRVLAVDMDAQANLSYTAGADMEGASTFEILMGAETVRAAVQHTDSGDILPGNKNLAGADTLLKDTGKEYRLAEALEEVKTDYDFIIIDTPPALGILTINALTVCDSVIIPAQADIYSIQGIEQLAETMKPVKKYCNPDLKIDGILLTRYSSRSILSREVAETAEELAGKLGTKLYKTRIRDAVAVKEAQLSQQSLFSYAPKAKVTEDYRSFIREILEDYGEKIHE